MKDKEKQIEEIEIREMARVFMTASCKGSECENCLFIKSVKEAEETCVCLKALYNAGYRKLSDSVVFSREEYGRLKEITVKLRSGNEMKIDSDNFAEIVEIIYNEASKETAEKIYLQAKVIVDATKYIVQGREYLHLDALKEIVKSCGVEIKE